MDYNAGLVLDELNTLKLEEKTLVVFLGTQPIGLVLVYRSR